MNPENIKEQVDLRHSTLWRKPLLYEKPFSAAKACHTQMNELGQTGISWRTRNNSIQTHFSFNKKQSIRRKTHSKQLSQILNEERRSSNEIGFLMRSLRDDADTIDRSEKLVTGMQELKKMNLLLKRDLQKVKFPGVGKYPHIHNDYHERIVNPGFSRNFLGKFYTK